MSACHSSVNLLRSYTANVGVSMRCDSVHDEAGVRGGGGFAHIATRIMRQGDVEETAY